MKFYAYLYGWNEANSSFSGSQLYRSSIMTLGTSHTTAFKTISIGANVLLSGGVNNPYVLFVSTEEAMPLYAPGGLDLGLATCSSDTSTFDAYSDGHNVTTSFISDWSHSGAWSNAFYGIASLDLAFIVVITPPPGGTLGPPEDVPELGVNALLAGLGITGTYFLLRRRKR